MSSSGLMSPAMPLMSYPAMGYYRIPSATPMVTAPPGYMTHVSPMWPSFNQSPSVVPPAPASISLPPLLSQQAVSLLTPQEKQALETFANKTLHDALTAFTKGALILGIPTLLIASLSSAASNSKKHGLFRLGHGIKQTVILTVLAMGFGGGSGVVWSFRHKALKKLEKIKKTTWTPPTLPLIR